jgi:hypothetical protein
VVVVVVAVVGVAQTSGGMAAAYCLDCCIGKIAVLPVIIFYYLAGSVLSLFIAHSQN